MAADWPQFQYNPQHTGFNINERTLNITNVSGLVQKWIFSTQGVIQNNSSPVIANGIVYIGSDDTYLYALDEKTGALIWKASTGSFILSAPAIANGIVYINSFEGGNLFAFDALTGNLIWKESLGSFLESPPTIVNGILYIGTPNSLVALNAATGTILWQSAGINEISGSPAVSNGIVYAGADDNNLYAFNASTGTKIWTESTGGTVNSSPSVNNGVVYVGSADSFFYAFNASNGSLLWRSETGAGNATVSTPAVANGIVYTAGGVNSATNSNIYAFNESTGNLIWKLPINGTRSSPTVANGVLYIGDSDGNVDVVNATTGELLKTLATRNEVDGVPAIVNGSVYVGSGNGNVYSYYVPGANTPPQVNPLSNATINEGSTYSASGSFTDSDSTSWTATVDYGDGSGVQPLSLNPDKTFTLSHVYKDNGIYTATVNVTDDGGLTGSTTATITVNNVVPTVGVISASINPIPINSSVSLTANFTDPGILDTHTAVWDFGDGSPVQNGTVTESNGSGSVTDSHTYTTTGVYIVTLSVTDKDGGVGTSMLQYLVVYDPSAGFVTGGGNINSPAGAEPNFPSVTGSASFGVNAKYTSANTTPIGSTKFSFPNGAIDFTSTSYDWLVVNGTTAFLHGHGTINGTGNYIFLVSVIDGSPDKFRIKITDASNVIVYDNQIGATDTTAPSEAIASGQIKIH